MSSPNRTNLSEKWFEDRRSLEIGAEAVRIWGVIRRIGGKQGWYHANWLWEFRKFLDTLAGGVGRRQGRRGEEEIRPGDTLDLWRVLEVEENKRLLLLAEMKLPGKATLEFNIIEKETGRCGVELTAAFQPRGFLGILYWDLVSPFHRYIFKGMLKKIAALAKDPSPLKLESPTKI